MYGSVLRLRLPKGKRIIGFADDIALEIRGKHFDELEKTCNTDFDKVRSWIAGIRLKFADEKTDVL